MAPEPAGRTGVAGCSNGRVDLDNRAKEINPNFDFRYDLPGRRFRLSDTRTWGISVTGLVNF